MGKINFFFMQQHLRLQELLIITLQKTELTGLEQKWCVYWKCIRTHAKDLKYQAKLSPIFLKSFIEGDELIPDFSVVFPKGGLREMGDKQSRVLRPVLIV